MNIVRIIQQGDNIILDTYMKNNIREHVSMTDMLMLYDKYRDILTNIRDRLIIDINTKVLLWRRKLIKKWSRHDMSYVNTEYFTQDEINKILSEHNGKFTNINNTSNINTTTCKINTYNNLLNYNVNIDRYIIEIPLCHTVRDYKIMIDNWTKYQKRFEFINTYDKYNAEYIHYILFNLILGKMSCIPNWIVFHDYNINIPVIDYLLHEYPNSIYKLYNFGTKKSGTVKSICIRYFPAYLDNNIVSEHWKKYYRMNIIRSNKFSDIILTTTC